MKSIRSHMMANVIQFCCSLETFTFCRIKCLKSFLYSSSKHSRGKYELPMSLTTLCLKIYETFKGSKGNCALQFMINLAIDVDIARQTLIANIVMHIFCTENKKFYLKFYCLSRYENCNQYAYTTAARHTDSYCPLVTKHKR